jgi:hypothetical protein
MPPIRVAGGGGDEDAARTAAAAQVDGVEPLDFREGLAEPAHDAWDSAVTRR